MTEETIDLLVLTTGGSIDAHFEEPAPKELIEVVNDPSEIPSIIRELELGIKIAYDEICTKMSDDITNDNRDRMYEGIIQSPVTYVVITHGLNSLKQTQVYLDDRLSPQRLLGSGKTVVLVGAKHPAEFEDSDAKFNLGFAIASAQTARPGVYRVDNGRLLDIQGRKYDHDQFRNATG